MDLLSNRPLEDDPAPPEMAPQAYFGNTDIASLPAGMRNNNPGNLKYKEGVNWVGSTGPSKNTDEGDPQVAFSSPQAGMNAAAKLAYNKYNGGATTLSSIMKVWSPNNPHAAKNLAATMGVSPNDDLQLNKPENLKSFLKAMVLQEHGDASSLYPDTMYDPAVARATHKPGLAGALQTVMQAGKNAIVATADTVKHIQQKLADAGFYQGKIDGVFGPQSKAAAEALHQQVGGDPIAALTSIGAVEAPAGQAITSLLEGSTTGTHGAVPPDMTMEAGPQPAPPAPTITPVSATQTSDVPTSLGQLDATPTAPQAPAPQADARMPRARPDLQQQPQQAARLPRARPDLTSATEPTTTGTVPQQGPSVDASGAPVPYSGDYNARMDQARADLARQDAEWTAEEQRPAPPPPMAATGQTVPSPVSPQAATGVTAPSPTRYDPLSAAMPSPAPQASPADREQAAQVAAQMAQQGQQEALSAVPPPAPQQATPASLNEAHAARERIVQQGGPQAVQAFRDAQRELQSQAALAGLPARAPAPGPAAPLYPGDAVAQASVAGLPPGSEAAHAAAQQLAARGQQTALSAPPPMVDPRADNAMRQTAAQRMADAQATRERINQQTEGQYAQGDWREQRSQQALSDLPGPPEQEMARERQRALALGGLPQDMQTAAFGGPDAPPFNAEAGAPQQPGTATGRIALNGPQATGPQATPPQMSLADYVSKPGGLTPREIQHISQQYANPPAGGVQGWRRGADGQLYAVGLTSPSQAPTTTAPAVQAQAKFDPNGPATTGSIPRAPALGPAAYGESTVLQGSQPGSVILKNQTQIRNNPLNAKTEQAFRYMSIKTGLEVHIMSGGQEAVPGRGNKVRYGPEGAKATGSHRHDVTVGAGDFKLFDPGENRYLSAKNPVDVPRMQEAVKFGTIAGFTGWGAETDYMGDETIHGGFGKEATWGPGGTGKPASWVDAGVAEGRSQRLQPAQVAAEIQTAAQSIGQGQREVNRALGLGGHPTLMAPDMSVNQVRQQVAAGPTTGPATTGSIRTVGPQAQPSPVIRSTGPQPATGPAGPAPTSQPTATAPRAVTPAPAQTGGRYGSPAGAGTSTAGPGATGGTRYGTTPPAPTTGPAAPVVSTPGPGAQGGSRYGSTAGGPTTVSTPGPGAQGGSRWGSPTGGPNTGTTPGPGAEGGARFPRAMSGKEKDDVITGPGTSEPRPVPTTSITGADLARVAPATEMPPEGVFVKATPPVTPGSTLNPKQLQATQPRAPVVAPTTTHVNPLPPNQAPVVPPPPAMTGVEAPSPTVGKTQEVREKYARNPIEKAAQMATEDGNGFDHAKFWDELGNHDLTQTQQAIASRTAATGHFQVNKLPGGLSMPNMGNVLGGVSGAAGRATTGLGGFLGSIFGGGGSSRSTPSTSSSSSSGRSSSSSSRSSSGGSSRSGGTYSGGGSLTEGTGGAYRNR